MEKEVYQRPQTPSTEHFVGFLGTAVKVAAKGTKYSHDLSVPVAAGLEPDKISSETSENPHTR